MDNAAIFLYASLAILLINLLIYKFLKPTTNYRLPPSPAAALPIVGHLHLLKPAEPLHRTFHRLSQKGGPIFSLRLGYRRAVVVSSPNLVEECFTKNDIVFANRPHKMIIGKYVGYNHTTMMAASYGEHWRTLRRIAAQELLSTSRLNAFQHIRKNEIYRWLLNLHNNLSHRGFSKMELRPKLSELTFDLLMRLIAGKRYSDEGKRNEHQKLINDVFEVSRVSSLQDFLVFLRWIDYGGFAKKMGAATQKMYEFFQSLVDEIRREKTTDSMISHLVSLQQSQPEIYSDLTIKGLMAITLLGGTEPMEITMEWAMPALLNNPRVLEKARQEIDAKIGHLRLIDEEDLPNLPYLQNIILETLRLFPVGPLLIPHESSEDCKLGGYDIPRGTIIFVNMWAIHRDPELWDDATSFKPERFEGKEVENHKLLPYGMGRRICPGIVFGQRVVGLTLGSMIQWFDWERISSEQVDLTEAIGGTMPKLKLLEVMCKPREIMHKVIQELSCNLSPN